MTSMEDQKRRLELASSSSLIPSEPRQLTKVEDEQNSTQVANSDNCERVALVNNAKTSKIIAKNDIELPSSIVSCNQEKKEGETVESNKKETYEKNAADSNIVPFVSENDSKMNESETTNETVSRGGSNLKRTRRNFVTQETDTSLEENNLRSKRKKKNAIDRFCWRCHKESVEAHCSACPRSWHRKCIGMQQSIIQNWICGECAAILRAENAETRSTAMAQLSIDQLCLLLKHVVERMREYPGSEPFWKAVELSEAPNYLDYVVKPMDLSLLESNVRSKLYGSTDAFMADAKWIQHNCIVFNTCGGVYADTSKLTNAAKQIIKLARQEVSEIEACPDCYAHGRNIPRPQPAWFVEPCRRPHPLVWAKLKGFPFWPAKAMPRMNTQGFVDVRFFGEHDRAWVSPRDLYLYSEDPPVPLPRKRRLDMEECVREITRHCRKLELAFGQFKFAPPKVQYNPHDPMQIRLMLPNYDPLCSNNYMSPQLFAPKKTPLLKKRSHVKAKCQSDSEKADNSDVENKTLNNASVSVEGSKIDDTVKVVEESCAAGSIEIAESRLDKSVERGIEDSAQNHKNGPTNLKLAIKEDLKPSTSKIDMSAVNNETGNAIRYDEKDSSILTQKQKDDNAMNEDSKFLVNSSKEDEDSLLRKQTEADILVPKKEPLFKMIIDKRDGNQSSSNSQRNSEIKGSKNPEKVYKPKTRIVDKINAEKALRSIATAPGEKSGKSELMNTVKQKDSKPTRNISKSNSNNNVNNNNNNNNNNISTNHLIAPNTLMNINQAQADIDVDHKVDEDTRTRKITEQPVVLLLNKNVSSNLPTEKGKRCDISAIQLNSKDSPRTCPTRESKARKSFSNKARNCPQLIPRSSSVLSNSNEAVGYMATHQFENSAEYQMLPPEAGPISARLYHDAQDLARKMAKLMEEAFREAAQDGQHCENGAMSDNHQATVHFLRLQMERMRWQHQQQLAELRHNTDRILREMKASLEAERLRAVEETRKEAEDERLRCIEEIKRKQWCAMCGREALFYCCWNTAYCDYPCQQSHWPMHMRTCAQKPSFTTIVTNSTANSNQQQVMPRLMLNTQHVTSNIQRA